MDTVLPFRLQSAPKIFSTEDGKRVAGHHIEKIEGPSMIIGHPDRRAKDGVETPRSEATLIIGIVTTVRNTMYALSLAR